MKSGLPCSIVSLVDHSPGLRPAARALFKATGVNTDSNESEFEACVTPDGRVVGASVVGLYDETPDDGDDMRRPRWTFSVAVDEGFRRKGVARALVRSLMAAHPRETVLLEGKVVNPYMADLLKSLGFYFYDPEHEDEEWDDHQRAWGRRMYLPNPTCWERLSERERVRLRTQEARDEGTIRRRKFPVVARLGPDGERVRVLGIAADLTGRVDSAATSANMLVARPLGGPDAGYTIIVPASSVYDDGKPWMRSMPKSCPGHRAWMGRTTRRNADEDLRRCERASQADPDDVGVRARLLAQEVRAGRLSRQALRLAALLGSEDAGIVTGVAPERRLSAGFSTPQAMLVWVNQLGRVSASRARLPRERVYTPGRDEVRLVLPGAWLAAVEAADGVFLMERPDLDFKHLQDEANELRRILAELRAEALRVIAGGEPDRALMGRLREESDELFERFSDGTIVPGIGMEALAEAAAVVGATVNLFETPRQTTTTLNMVRDMLDGAVRVISLGDAPTTARMGDWHDLSQRVLKRMIRTLTTERFARRTNPGDMPLVPLQRTGADLPAIPTQGLPRHEWRPPRVSFELMLSGKTPLTYVPEGVYEHPAIADVLGRLLTRRGIADVGAWEDLLSVCGTRARLFVVDRAGERWEVMEVRFDRGEETGQLVVRHLGPRSRFGDALIDIHAAYGRMLPVVVYRPRSGVL